MNLDRLAPFISPILKRALKPMAANARAHFAALPVAADRVVFLGDSITAGGYWDEWFPEFASINRGIDGNTVGDVLGRLDTAIHSPRLVSLLIGTNDLSGLGRSRDPAEIAAQVRELVTRIRTAAPTAKLLINSVAPRSAFFAERIRVLNQHYRQIASEVAADYVDLWPAMANSDGAIHKALTTDGIHFTGAGYRVWAEILRPYLVDVDAETQRLRNDQLANAGV